MFGEQEKIVCGECFAYSIDESKYYFDRNDVQIVHAKVSPQGSNKPPFWHAWVEVGNRVYDWQTMKAGIYPKFKKCGWPKKFFYEFFRPTDIRVYGPERALVNMVRAGHKGPWEPGEI